MTFQLYSSGEGQRLGQPRSSGNLRPHLPSGRQPLIVAAHNISQEIRIAILSKFGWILTEFQVRFPPSFLPKFLLSQPQTKQGVLSVHIKMSKDFAIIFVNFVKNITIVCFNTIFGVNEMREVVQNLMSWHFLRNDISLIYTEYCRNHFWKLTRNSSKTLSGDAARNSVDYSADKLTEHRRRFDRDFSEQLGENSGIRSVWNK